jgi:leader peptidase (prepilin peptidase)/N-methyltransferase
MRGLLWALLGAAAGYKVITRARIDVPRLRLTGQTFGYANVSAKKFMTPLVIAICAGLFYGLEQRLEETFTVLAFGLLVAVGVLLTLIDIDTHLLPRRIVYGATGLAIPLLLLAALNNKEGEVLGMFIGAIAMRVFLRVLQVLSRGDMGSGDVTLGGFLGLYLGWISFETVLVGLLAGFLAGGVFALFAVLLRKAGRNTRFAFGPFLIVGALVAVLR